MHVPSVWQRVRGGRTTEAWLSLVRLLVLLSLIPASWFGLIAVPRPTTDIVMLLLGGYVILLAAGPGWLPILRKIDLIITLDLLVVTLVVLVSGQVRSPFLYLYYLVILEAASRFNLRQALAASTAMAAVLVLLWVREGHTEMFTTAGFHLGAFVASGFFLALLMGVLVQEYRISQARVEELQFDAELASQLSGELRVKGVAERLLHMFLEITRLSKGAVYLVDEHGRATFTAARGFAWENGDPSPGHLAMPAAAAAVNGDLITQPGPPQRGRAHSVMLCVPLVRNHGLQMWLCGLSDAAPTVSDAARRHLRSMAVQGISALEAARLHEQVAELAATDSLTGVANRRAFFDRLAAELARSHRSGRAVGIAVLDLNGFKGINDGYGHSVGDEVLIRVAQALSRGMRTSDLVARLGGDEFALLLPETAPDEAAKVLDRLCAAEISAPDGRGRDLHVGLCWGIAAWPEDGDSPEQLLQAADQRLYAMKRRVRGET